MRQVVMKGTMEESTLQSMDGTERGPFFTSGELDRESMWAH